MSRRRWSFYTSTPSTSTPTRTPGSTPPPTFTPGINLQVTIPTPQCQNTPCIGPLPATSTPVGMPTPFLYDVVTNPNVQQVAQSVDPLSSIFPTDFGPDLGAVWDDLLFYGLPALGYPATTLTQVANSAVSAVATYGTYAVNAAASTAINATRAISTALTNTGLAVNQAIGNGLHYGPVMPVFYIPSPYDLFPITSQEPVYY